MADHAVLSAQTAEDCVVDQHWERYDAEDHAFWRTLFERQQATLKDHVCEEYLRPKPHSKSCRPIRSSAAGRAVTGAIFPQRNRG
ncbi:MAG TPA: hypothetical protein VEH77_20230 [Roseiarcus sp.]|nr:hypothetical protein [Roseiarcus sp.]